jgi:PPOX class probable F420-dependent enzyme
MAGELSPDQEALLKERHLALLVTLMPGGEPQVTPVWIDVRDGLVLVNTVVGRVKEQNVRRDPRVAVVVVDENDDYRWVSIRGRVVELTREGADEHIDALAKKYLGEDRYPWHKLEEKRIMMKIRPERVTG